ncbi:MAG TPA: OmpA family protein [Rhodopila sp.]
MLVTAGWLLAGCSTASLNPVNWWHRQEGGKIAEERPAPPGADQPYPNISTVPAKPEPPDPEALKKLTDSLVADRTNAQHAAQAAPLADPSSPSASPNLFGVGTAPPPPPPGATPPTKAGTSGAPQGPTAAGAPSSAPGTPGAPFASASLPAVTAPPAAPSAAPRKPVQSAPLAAPDTEPTPGAPTPGAASSVPAVASPTAPAATTAPAQPPAAAAANPARPPAISGTPDSTVAGVSPPLPDAPPARPAGAPPPPAAPIASNPMPVPSTGTSATIVFVDQASNLSQPAADEVKAFATKRGNGTISVTGYGDSTSNDPDAQSAALNLGLSRAQSIVDALKAAGVPGNAIRVSAEASGHGASLRLLQ